MDIHEPLFAFEIIPAKAMSDIQQDGSNTQASMKINNTTFVGKGTIDYCLDVRREVLANRGFVVPQDWELTWNRTVGPVWTPDQMPDIHMWCHQKGIFNDTTDTTLCTKWQSELDENHYFSQSIANDCPSIGTNGQNGFKYLNFNGLSAGQEYMAIPLVHHSDHPLEGQATTCDFNPGDDTSGNSGKGDFIMAIVMDGDIDSQSTNARGVISNIDRNGWVLEKNTSDNASIDMDGNIMVSVNSFYDDVEIVILAKISGATSLRSSGEAPTVSAVASQDCSVTYSAADTGRGQLGRAQTNKYASMHLYEFVLAKGNNITLDDVKKLEGYFAAKYNIAVPTDNTSYSATVLPRQGAV